MKALKLLGPCRRGSEVTDSLNNLFGRLAVKDDRPADQIGPAAIEDVDLAITAGARIQAAIDDPTGGATWLECRRWRPHAGRTRGA